MAVAILLFGAIVLIAFAVIALTRWERRRRLRATLLARLEALEPDRVQIDNFHADWIEHWLAAAPPTIRIWLGRADMQLHGRALTIYFVAVGALSIVLGQLFGIAGVAAAVVLGLAAPMAGLYALANYRLAAFLDALPYFLDAVRQLLVVGNSVQQALLKAADNASPAVQRYMAPSLRRISNGAPIPEAILVAADRVAAPELYMLATAVRTNMRFGGPVAPILGDFADMLRDRVRVGREISAATSEIRLSALILCALPVVAIALLTVVNFNYVKFLWEVELGRKLLATALTLQVTGMLAMRRLARVDF